MSSDRMQVSDMNNDTLESGVQAMSGMVLLTVVEIDSC